MESLVLKPNGFLFPVFQMRNSNPFIGNPNYDVVYSDFNFDLHDLNKDKFITKREFAHSERVRQGDVDHVFSFVDVNGRWQYGFDALYDVFLILA